MPSLISRSQITSWSIFFIGKILLLLGVLLFISSDGLRNELTKITSQQPLVLKQDRSNSSQSQDINALGAIIASRNLFGAQEVPKPIAKPEEKKTNLNLRLVGTLITPTQDPIAIVEDKKSHAQNAFGVGEIIFDTKAKITSIHVGSVKILHQGSTETLEVEEGVITSSSDDSPIQSADGTFIIPEEELNAALANLPVLLSQARAIPFFRNGKSQGMRLYAIRSGSLYEKLGLKNSDIIKGINDNAVTDPSKALKLFEDLKTERSIHVDVERQGEDIKLKYEIR